MFMLIRSHTAIHPLSSWQVCQFSRKNLTILSPCLSSPFLCCDMITTLNQHWVPVLLSLCSCPLQAAPHPASLPVRAHLSCSSTGSPLQSQLPRLSPKPAPYKEDIVIIATSTNFDESRIRSTIRCVKFLSIEYYFKLFSLSLVCHGQILFVIKCHKCFICEGLK